MTGLPMATGLLRPQARQRKDGRCAPHRRPCLNELVDVRGRSFPEPQPDERAALTQWLDWQRATVVAKCEGLTDEAARRSVVPTSPAMTVAGVVSHLTVVERHWHERSFLGVDVRTDDGGWLVEHDLGYLVDLCAAQCTRSRQIVATHELDTQEAWSPPGLPIVSLRWILGHLIQGRPRHAGHLICCERSPTVSAAIEHPRLTRPTPRSLAMTRLRVRSIVQHRRSFSAEQYCTA